MMQTDGFNKCIFHLLTTSELIAGLSLNIYKLFLWKNYFHMPKMNDMFYFWNPTIAFYYMVLWNAWFSGQLRHSEVSYSTDCCQICQ